MGLLLNLWVVFILWLGGILPGFEAVDPATGELVRDAAGRLPLFFEVRSLTFAVVVASMGAYLTAQFVDVQLFHFWKELTAGKQLWLRNNGSTLVSQLVDTTTIVLISYYLTDAVPIDPSQNPWPQLLALIAYGYSFKLVAALLDTGPFYLLVYGLSKYLQLESPLVKAAGSPQTMAAGQRGDGPV